MGLRILVVEDDRHIRRILGLLLSEELGAGALEIVLATDGREGLDALEKGPFDLVITDLLMPRVDGFEFGKALRAHRFGATVPLIVTSSIYRDPAAQERMQREVGAHLFFTKPFDMRELVKAARRLIGDGPPSGSIRTSPGSQPGVPLTAMRSGSLGHRAAACVLFDLCEQQVVGTVVLQRGKIRKQVAMVRGVIVGVESNVRSEALGQYLIGAGMLDERRLHMALARAQQSHQLLGRALIELGWLNERELQRQLAGQRRAKVVSMLRWQEGEWSFTPGEPNERTPTLMDGARLILSGLQKTTQVDDMARRFGGAPGRIFPTARAERQRAAFANVFGTRGLDVLAQRPLISEFLQGGNLAAMLAELEALLLCRLAELESAADDDSAAEDSDPLGLRVITPSGEMPAVTPPSLYDQLMSEETTIVPPPTPSPEVEALRREILAEYLALPGRDHYQLLGVARDATNQDISDHFIALRQKFRLERFAKVDLGRDYMHVEELHQAFAKAHGTLTSTKLRADYDRTLIDLLPPSNTHIDAELLAGEAAQLLEGGDPTGARTKLELAVAVRPDEASYHALLGWTAFCSGDVARAWRDIGQALTIDPDNVDAHEYAGRLAGAVGDDAGAVKHLELVLDSHPSRTNALSALEAAQARRGEWKRLERQYRKLIHGVMQRSTDRDRSYVASLWWRLAELYRVRLHDPESAKTAYEVYARLVPEDARPQQILAELGGSRSAAESWDAAWVAAAAAVGEGKAGQEQLGLYERYRPRFLQRAAGVLVVDSVRHRDEDAHIAQLFALIFPAKSAAKPGKLGAIDSDAVSRKEMSEPFARVLSYVAALLGGPPPAVFRRGGSGVKVTVGGNEPPSLLVSLPALALTERPELAFHFGRAMSLFGAGRSLVAALSPRQLKETLLAAFTLVEPKLKIDDPDSAVAALRSRLAAAGPSLAASLAPHVRQLLGRPDGVLDVTRHAQGLWRTADRVGLVVCNDPAVAIRLAGEGAHELAGFACSADHLSLRDTLGLSLAV